MYNTIKFSKDFISEIKEIILVNYDLAQCNSVFSFRDMVQDELQGAYIEAVCDAVYELSDDIQSAIEERKEDEYKQELANNDPQEASYRY